MANDYIPDADGLFLSWEQNLLDYAGANLVALGLVAGDLTAATALRGDWEIAYASATAAEAAFRQAVQLKREKRSAFEVELRMLVRRLQASAAVDNMERQALGITVPDSEPTPVGPPTSRPVLQADTSAPGRLTIGFADEGTPTKKAKPAGVSACLLQCKKGGAAPAGDGDWEFLAVDSGTPYLAVFDSAEAGQAVWVRGCWINTKQEPGAWSNVLSTRVPG
jgi:hypothetical protein